MADSFSQTVKDQTDIVRIIGEYVKLRKAGRAELYGVVSVSQGEVGELFRECGEAVLLLLRMP